MHELDTEKTRTVMGKVMVATLDLGEWSREMRGTEVSCSSQLYSVHPTIYTPRIKKNHVSQV